MVRQAERLAADVVSGPADALRLSLDFLGPVSTDPVVVVGEVVRTGRSITLVDVTLSQGGRAALHGRVWVLRRAPEGTTPTVSEVPRPPGPRLARPVRRCWDFPYARHLDWRAAGGTLVGPGPARSGSVPGCRSSPASTRPACSGPPSWATPAAASRPSWTGTSGRSSTSTSTCTCSGRCRTTGCCSTRAPAWRPRAPGCAPRPIHDRGSLRHHRADAARLAARPEREPATPFPTGRPPRRRLGWCHGATATRPGPGQRDGGRPRRQRGDDPPVDGAGRRARRPPGGLPRDGADRLPRGGPRAAGVVRRRLAGRARRSSRPTSPPTAWATCRSSSATSTTPATGHRRQRPGRDVLPAELRRRPARGPGQGPLRQAPPAQLRRLRRVPHLRPRHRPDRRPGRRHRRGHRHLRGPVAGGRPGRPHPRGGRRAAAGHQRLAVRARTRTTPGWSCARAARRRPAARWPTSTSSAARTSSSSTATRWSSTRPARCSPAAPQFARGPAGGRPRPAPRAPSTRPSPPEGVVHVTLSDQPIAPYAAEPAPHAPRLDPVGEVYEALDARAAGLRAQERLPLGAARRLRRHRLHARGDHRGRRDRRGERRRHLQPEPLLQPALPRRRRGARRAPRPGLPRHPDRADGQRVPRQRRSCPASRRRTSRRACGRWC